MGMVDNTLFTKKSKSRRIIVQIYVDDIIFGSTSQNLCDDFAKIMHDEFEMSMMGELNFFLGLQIKQMKDGIIFNQSKYIKEMLKKFGLEDSKPAKTPMSTEIKLTKDDDADSVNSSKYQGDYVDRKSTSGVCMFMGCCLTSWFAKKQMALAIFTTKAEYVSARKACQQALWMKQALIDYGIRLDDVPIMFIFEFYNHFSIQFIINNHHFNLSLAQFAELTHLPNQGICIYSDAWGLDELDKTLEQIEPYDSRLPALDDIQNLIHRRTIHEKIDKEGNTIHKLRNQIETNELFDHLRPYLPSTKLSPGSYHRALKDDPNMSKEQRETRGMFKNLGQALHNFERILKKGCR
ncbi:retrovirus-related pol polyprotein from transposon TNT 1-94 [Tanacetum coccineum]|uniref:Retrovirus-related pol polyprotein from transposon TNT 1-94 n=1 Tax=Tanacetum coccineum TaxID=301880 RepID=A0ABQ5FK15_9ASTR